QPSTKPGIVMVPVRVGFGPRSPFADAQLVDFSKRQKRRNRSFRRSEVHGGYTGYEFFSSGQAAESPEKTLASWHGRLRGHRQIACGNAGYARPGVRS